MFDFHTTFDFRVGCRTKASAVVALWLMVWSGSAVATMTTVERAAESQATMSSTLRLAATRSHARDVSDDYRVDATGHGTNARHGLTLLFTPGGVLINGSDGELALSLKRFGRGDGEPVLHTPPRIDGAWVEYERAANLNEWFVNVPRGVEQGWTVTQRPSGTGPLMLALDTARAPERIEEGRLTWAGLTYDKLVAVDAEGQTLPSHWVLDGSELRIEIDDTAAAYPVLIDPWLERAKVTASDGAASDEFGFSVAVSGDTALVGAHFATVNGGYRQGAVYVFTRSGDVWTEQAKLTASDGAPDNQFGSSISFRGGTAVVGAVRANQGAAYVFVRDGDTWSEQAKLTASDGADGDLFGFTVAYASDTAVIGAHHVNSGQGAAYVFVRDGDTWSEQAKLTASDGAENDQFGVSVAISGDTAVIGAWLVDASNAALDSGAAYVFVRDGVTWNEQAKLSNPDAVQDDHFGVSVAVSNETALVGAWDDDPGLFNQGSAYVFIRNGDVWNEQAQLVASDGVDSDHFGFSVALLADTAVVGAYGADVGSNFEQGAAYVFTRKGDTWDEQAKLTALDGATADFFGNAVAVSGDGTVMVGSQRAVVNGNFNSGAAYVFGDGGLPKDFATIEGTVQSLGACGTNVAPRAEAGVEIVGAHGTFILETDSNGFYQTFLPDSESPFNLTVSAPGHLPVTVEGINFNGGDTVTNDINLTLDAPCVAPDSAAFAFELQTDQQASETFGLGNTGVADLVWSIFQANAGADGNGNPYAHEARTHSTFHSPTGHDRLADAEVQGEPAARKILPVPQGSIVLQDIEEEFDDITELPGAGWAMINNSVPLGITSWFQGDPTVFPAHQGAETAYIGANFNNVGGSGTISNWLVTPEIVLVSGTELRFWTRTTEQFQNFNDRLEVRLSTAGESTDVGDTSYSVGDFTDVLLTINPELLPNTYPDVWTEFVGTITNRPTPIAGRFAFRYWVTNAGPLDEFGNYIGIDTVSIAQPEGAGCWNPADIPWLSVSPQSGTTPPNANSDVEVAVDTTGLDAGEYMAQLCVVTNAPNANLIAVPVALTVTGAGDVIFDDGFDGPPPP